MEPPAGLLQKVQSIEVNLWDNTGYHRVYFTCQTAGGALVSAPGEQSRRFQAQFFQRYLTGSDDVVWKPATSIILRGVAGLG